MPTEMENPATAAKAKAAEFPADPAKGYAARYQPTSAEDRAAGFGEIEGALDVGIVSHVQPAAVRSWLR